MASNMDAIETSFTVLDHLFFTDMDAIEYFKFFSNNSMESSGPSYTFCTRIPDILDNQPALDLTKF